MTALSERNALVRLLAFDASNTALKRDVWRGYFNAECRAPRRAGVVTLIPEVNGSEDDPVIMVARGGASMYRVPGRAPWAPGASHRHARGSPHGITSDLPFGLIYLPA